MEREADRWRYRAAFEQQSPPPQEAQAEEGAEAMRELADFRKYADAVNADATA